jgi:hypothetical protein
MVTCTVTVVISTNRFPACNDCNGPHVGPLSYLAADAVI